MVILRRYPWLGNPSNPLGNKPTSLKKLLLCLVLVICSRVRKKAVYECFNDSLVLNGTFPWKLARCALKNIACWTLQNRSTHLAFMKEQDLCLRYTSGQASQVLADSCRACKEGWALKRAKKAERFNEAQKSYLEAKFNIGQSTGKKLDPDVVAKEMRRARGPSGDRLFAVTAFLSAQQISSFFSRLAAKARQKEVQVTEQDALAVEEEVNFSAARDRVLSSLHVIHPIVVDQYDLCALVKSKEIKKLKVGLLQVLCESLDLQTPIPPVRKKAPYVSLLQGLVESCSCSTM